MPAPSKVRSARSKSTTTSISSLERYQSIASIASAIAVPIVLAVVGYYIQKQLADEGLKKDYVSIATNILKEDAKHQEPELRDWAVTMLDANSPVAFSKKAKEGLKAGTIVIGPAVMPTPADWCMTLPHSPRIRRYLDNLSKEKEMRMGSVDTLRKEFGTLLELAVKAEGEAEDDRISLKCLQGYASVVTDDRAKPIARIKNNSGSPHRPVNSASQATRP